MADPTISVITDGVEIPIGTMGKLIGHDGWGMPPMHRLEAIGALQDGSTDMGYKLEPRIGKFVFNIGAATLEDMYVKRAEILRYFRPELPLQVKFTIGELVKVIDCHYDGEMGFSWDAAKWGAQKYAINLKCNDPTFYNPDIQVIGYGGGGSTGFVVNVVVPMKFGQSTLSSSQIINNIGDADTYPIIAITGPIEDPVITNTTYGEKLSFNGTHIAAGVTYEIDTRYGIKTVFELPSTNRYYQLTDDSDLATFRLRCKNNEIMLEGTGITSATIVYVKYYYRYLGV